MPSVPPDLLINPSEVVRYGVPSAFAAQFAVRAIEVQILAGGNLGAMTFTWRKKGEQYWNATPISTSAGMAWSYTIDAVFADLTWTDQVFVATTVYTIDEAGTVTGGAGLAAVRWSKVQIACSATTAEIMQLWRDAVKPPVTSWSDAVRTHAAAMVHAWLKVSVGITAEKAGEGDKLVFDRDALARAFFVDIGENGRPDDLIDSSPTADGPMFAAYPVGDDDRNWRDAF